MKPFIILRAFQFTEKHPAFTFTDLREFLSNNGPERLEHNLNCLWKWNLESHLPSDGPCTHIWYAKGE